jgi:hemerythrin-like domain-containing protein
MKRARELRPLSSEHHQALLVAFQLKKGLAGHAESAGAPKDLPGLLALARRYEETILRTHAKAEEDLLSRFISAADARRLSSEHQEMQRLVTVAKGSRTPEIRNALQSFADLLERHIRWEERELFPAAEQQMDAGARADVLGELEKRLVLSRSEGKAQRAGK